VGGTTRWCAIALGLLAVGCGGGDGGGEDGPTTTADTSTTTTALPTEPTYEVGQEDLTLVDPSRPTPAVAAAGRAELPDRTIHVTVLFPADAGAPAEGPFPLVVFAHGWNGQGRNFVPIGERWAEAGYVVALPTFPLSREGIAFGDDYVNQPGDVSFVIDELLAATGDLAGLIDGDRVALGGHSLGSATVFRAAYNACCADDRIDATFPVSGGPADIGQGGYETWRPTPMLLVHGVLDPLVPIAIGDAVFELARVPVRYLRMDQADHTSVFADANGELFAAAVLDFLDATLRDDDEALDDLAALVSSSGIAELRVRTSPAG
jgi:dienelactone hydrolase